MMKNLFKIAIISQILILFSCKSNQEDNQDATVYVSKTPSGYQLIRNGEKFFIKGSSGNSYFNELKKAGANTIRIYDTTNLAITLDTAYSAGLAVVLDIPVPRYKTPDTIYSSKMKMKNLFKHTNQFVNKYKDHPAILYWMLGNELKAPDLPGDKNFYTNFNELIKTVKKIDKNHPVSTAIGGFDRSKILSINNKTTGLDLISINVFGELSTFNSRKKNISLLWNGPYVFSEFGVNGPWEADKTLWDAPIEATSTKKAEHYKERYRNYINTIDDNRFLGALTFFWGHKQERTHTWFSFFSEKDKKTQTVFEMENIWKNLDRDFPGPEINYLLLNGKSDQESILLNTNELAKVELLFLKDKESPTYKAKWEILPENWNYRNYDTEIKPQALNNLIVDKSLHNLNFITPKEEGPYRLFVYIEDNNGFFATANIPFYVLNSNHD